ncbi:hypothetical protein [Priestia endophytica]|uniref:Uncharacterized protein n=1 Tax=Priestia endophytica TaxID=135735 RepID=A0AAX1Q635_9BACI|nr:hypothetical protein [Priestia endophytica]RAS74471.1 hypothetical protein A3864_18655 [Priestia endophytica]
MKTLFKALIGGIGLSLLYALIILVAPMIMMIMGINKYTSTPELLGFPIYQIGVNGNEFDSSATGMGFILSIIMGIIFYYLVRLLIPKRNAK